MEKRRKQVLAASFLAGAFAVTAGFAVQGHARAAQYRRMLDNTYQHAFTELATAAGELDVALRKVTYATSPELFSALCAQAYSKALAAQSALGELPYGNVELEQTARLPGQNRRLRHGPGRDAYGETACTEAHGRPCAAWRGPPPPCLAPSRACWRSWTRAPSDRRTWRPFRHGCPTPRSRVNSPPARPSRRWRPTSPRCPP